MTVAAAATGDFAAAVVAGFGAATAVVGVAFTSFHVMINWISK